VPTEEAVPTEEVLVASADAGSGVLLDAAEFARLVARLHAEVGEEDNEKSVRRPGCAPRRGPAGLHHPLGLVDAR
jgi:hypothetical protein